MALFVTVEHILEIATHHDKRPTDYGDFPGPAGLVLATRDSGCNSLHRHRMHNRIREAIEVLQLEGGPVTALLPLVGGTCVEIYVKEDRRGK